MYTGRAQDGGQSLDSDSLHGSDTMFLLLCSFIYKLSISPKTFDSLINKLLS